MDKILDFLYTKKMWVGGAVAAVGQYVDLVRSVIADESVSFTEAETVVRAGIALVISLAVMFGVYKAKNAPAPTPTTTNGTITGVSREDF